MTKPNDLSTSDEAIESILQNAPPRPTPSAADIASARGAVRAEWQALTNRRRTRRQLVSLAAAATLLIAVAAGMFMLRVPSALPEEVATIERSVGSIYLLGEQSALHEVRDLADLSSGQTLVTADGAAVALAWLRGGSLRIGEDSRVEFLSPGEIFLRDGRVYFDSQMPPAEAGTAMPSGAKFAIRTSDGLIRHLGTQYMANVAASGVTVTVREGQVQILGDRFDATATAGQQVRVQGNARPSYANIDTYGEMWRWAEKIAPTVVVDKRSAHQFIAWVARESGLDVRFASGALQQVAHTTHLSGDTGGLEPTVALQVLLQTTTLEATIVDGSILVTER